MEISILSFNNGKHLRGAEIWAQSLQEKMKDKYEIKIFESFSKWVLGDINIPINGRWQVFICRFLTWIRGKPMVVFGHSGLGADDKWNLLCSPDIFVAFSDYQKGWAEKYKLPWTKIVKISHAIDLTRFSPAACRPDNKTVLCVAANTPDKRVGLVAAAVKLIHGVNFMAIGKGNPVEASFEEMPEIYKKADLFCFVPQSWEAFGLVYLEAMASNLPVVTVDDPIRREIVGEAGIFVKEPISVDKLTSAIEFAMKSDWKDIPRKQAEKFSWNLAVKEYDKLFRSLIK